VELGNLILAKLFSWLIVMYEFFSHFHKNEHFSGHFYPAYRFLDFKALFDFLKTLFLLHPPQTSSGWF